MKPLVFASGNAHKAREMSEVLKFALTDQNVKNAKKL